MAAKILAFAGSTRDGSFNKKLLRIAVQGARDAGAEVTELDLRDLPMPLYDGDLQASQGFPPNAKRFKELVAGHPGLLIASPEYNWGMSGVLKNALDWASRGEGKEAAYTATRGHWAAVMSAAIGVYGGVRGLLQLRATLTALKVIALPDQVALTKAKESFNDDGSLKDPAIGAEVTALGSGLAKLVAKLG
jgi:chromate reductase